MLDQLNCEKCGCETNHAQVDLGFGWNEYGSHGQNHTCLVWECIVCGALRENDDNE